MKHHRWFRGMLCLLSASAALGVVVTFLWLWMPQSVLSAESLGEIGAPSGASGPSAPAKTIPIPRSDVIPVVNGTCDLEKEYKDAAKFTFNEMGAAGPFLASVYLKHDNTNLYVCMQAMYSQVSSHFASVYLDYDNGREHFATYDDLSLRVDVMEHFTSTYRGTGVPAGYVPGFAPGWTAKTAQAGNDMAEYQIPIKLATVGGLCRQPFGLAVYHHWVKYVGDDYGWPSNNWWDQPWTWQTVQLENADCRPKLPVFKLTPATVTGKSARGLAQGLSGIGDLPVFDGTSHTGTPLFTVPNTTTGSLLEMYGATGGFFAFNAGEAFSTTNRGRLDPQIVKSMACQFLLSKGLFPTQATPPEAQACQPGIPGQLLPYQVTGIYAGMAPNAPGAQAPSQVVTTGVQVQIPLGLDVDLGNRIPLGGPGGHLSMVVVSTTRESPMPLLDGAFPGLAALAEPFSRTLTVQDDYPLIGPSQAGQALQALMPGVVITPGNPELIYYVDDAAVPQENLVPTWYFPDATALVDGHEVQLRGTSVPAVEGFFPVVDITAPPNGTVFLRGAHVNLTGKISGGTPPYNYTWFIQDTSVMTGTTPSGEVSLLTDPLPGGRSGDPVSVRLLATDNNGASSEDLISLVPGPSIHLPLIMNRTTGLSRAQALQPASPEGAQAPAATYWFGIEAGWDYPPYGPGGNDLPGVIPDANGLKNGMTGYGWNQRFYWYNAAAWEKDWRDCSLGGIDCTYGVDRADFVYYAGHGGGGGLSMPSTTHDSGWAAGSNMRFQSARWIGFASCATLRAQGYADPTDAPIFTQFHDSFRGSHMLLGFNSGMADVAFGPRLMHNLRAPTWFGFPIVAWQNTIPEAWVLTAFEMNAGKPAYMWVVSNSSNPFYDKLPHPVFGPAPQPRPYPFHSWNWVWWDE